jgi:hypothetical protein
MMPGPFDIRGYPIIQLFYNCHFLENVFYLVWAKHNPAPQLGNAISGEGSNGDGIGT